MLSRIKGWIKSAKEQFIRNRNQRDLDRLKVVLSNQIHQLGDLKKEFEERTITRDTIYNEYTMRLEYLKKCIEESEKEVIEMTRLYEARYRNFYHIEDKNGIEIK